MMLYVVQRTLCDCPDSARYASKCPVSAVPEVLCWSSSALGSYREALWYAARASRALAAGAPGSHCPAVDYSCGFPAREAAARPLGWLNPSRCGEGKHRDARSDPQPLPADPASCDLACLLDPDVFLATAPMPGHRQAAPVWYEAYESWMASFPALDLASAYYLGVTPAEGTEEDGYASSSSSTSSSACSGTGLSID